MVVVLSRPEVTESASALRDMSYVAWDTKSSLSDAGPSRAATQLTGDLRGALPV